jgi:exopolysaccharide biosynthesis polyprenyl glycosylphosphotransferase
MRQALLGKPVRVGADLLALVLAHVFAMHLVQHFLDVPAGHLNPQGYQLYFIPFFALMLYFFNGSRSAALLRPERELEQGCKAAALVFLGLLVFNFVVFKSQPISRYLLAFWFGLAVVLLLFVRFAQRAVRARLWKAGLAQRRVLLVGSASGLAGCWRLLSLQRCQEYRLLGWLAEAPLAATRDNGALPLPRLGEVSEWEEIVNRTGAGVLVIAFPAFANGHEHFQQVVRRARELGLEVELYFDALATLGWHCALDEFSGCLCFQARPSWSTALQRGVKHALDYLIGFAGSATTLLIAPIVALLVKLEDGGAVFHWREFVGPDGQVHYYRKFRTMREDADEVLRNTPALKREFAKKFKLANDPRVLRIGRFLRRYSLDEFPQFFSVLRGQLTLVGPRMISWEEREFYGEHLAKLLSVKPGLTGFWQTSGRQTTTYEERVWMDMFYVDHWSIWLDLVIIAKTVWKVFSAEGAH